jgi:hypothetical protein
MSQISVLLTTSKYATLINATELNESYQKFNIPICKAKIGLGMFGFGPELEQQEHSFSEICKDMAKQVWIYPETQTVRIGMDETDNEQDLVTYQVEKPSCYTEEFFKRWQEIHCLLFEFSVFDQEGSPRFALKGLWLYVSETNKGWKSLEVLPTETMFHD